MKNLSKQIILCGIIYFLAFAAFATSPVETSIAPMLQKVLPAIVNIRAKIRVTDFNTLLELKRQQQKATPNPEQGPTPATPNTFTSVGSGVIVDATNGYLLTNAHVVNDAQNISVTLGDGRHFTAKTIGLDKPSDVALLQIKAKNLTSLTIADSSKLKVGDFVAAIGNPFGLNQSVTSGIVSALGRNTLGIENYENFIQTDASINPGNSGGALINMQGELVGINTAILTPARGNIGIGFAIPSNMVKSVMLQLLEYGNVKRGILGIGAEDITPELATAFHHDNGAIVTQVLPYSPAQLAGMQVGDVIVDIDGNSIKNASDVINTIAFLRVDSKATINVLRAGKPISIHVSLSDPSKRKELAQKADPFFYGVTLKNFDINTPAYGELHGILVVNADEDSLAWQSDIRAGDVITSVNQVKVSNIAELRAQAAKNDTKILVNVIRGGSAVFLLLNKEGS